MSLTAEFRDVVGNCQEALDKATFLNRWKPPGSRSGFRYHVLIKGVATGVKTDEKTGARHAWIRLDQQITEVLDELPSEHGNVIGKEFATFFGTRANQVNQLQELFSLADMASGGDYSTSRDLTAAIEELESRAGKIVVKFCMKLREYKGTEYPNESYEGIVDGE